MLHAPETPAFHGPRDALRAFLRQRSHGFYTYLLLRPDGTPFYVGKGTGTRVLHHELEALRQSNLPVSNPFKCKTIRRIHAEGGEILYQIDRIYESEDQLECLRREESLIARHRRRCDGGCLTNLAAGLGSVFAPDPLSTARHSATLSGVPKDRPERAALNMYLATLGAVDSVPIKPLSEYRNRLVAAYPSPKALKTPSRRNGLTLIASALACGLRLVPGVIIPRAFTLVPDFEDWPLEVAPPKEVVAVIENGAASDVLKLGLATLVPAGRPQDEGFAMDAQQVIRLVALMSRDWLDRWELL